MVSATRPMRPPNPRVKKLSSA